MIQSVKPGKEIIVSAKNEAGLLSKLSKLFADRGVNIIAISAQVAGGAALLNFVVDEHVTAMDLLRKKKYQVHENNVVLVQIEDKPGAMLRMTQRLMGKKIDLVNIYGSATNTYSPCLLVFSTNNDQKAMVALRKK